MTLDHLAAVFAAIAGFSLGLREIVLSPRNSTFPEAPLLVRMSMFVLAGALGVLAIIFWQNSSRLPFAGRAEVPLLISLAAQALANFVLVVNLFRQRYRPETWRRLNKVTLLAKLSCRHEHALRLRTDP